MTVEEPTSGPSAATRKGCAMDDDQVLRSLGADLEHDDPGLAAFLSGQAPSPHRHSAAWMLLTLPLLLPALLLPARVTLGLVAVLLILASPVIACWLCETTEDPATRRT